MFVIFYQAFLSVCSGKFSGYLIYCGVQPLKPKSFLNLIYYSQLQDKCRTISKSAKYLPVGEPSISPPPLPSQAAEDQTFIAEKDVRPKMKNINRFPLLLENSTKQASDGTNKTMDLPLKSEHKPWVASTTEDEAVYDILKRCSQCGILLPLPTLDQHQVPSLCFLLTWLSTIWTGLREIQALQDVPIHCHWEGSSLSPPSLCVQMHSIVAFTTWFVCIISQSLGHL